MLCRLLEEEVPKDAQILEAGCGMGQYVYLLDEMGYRVTGADVTADTIERVRAVYPHLDLRVQDVTKLDLPEKCRDRRQIQAVYELLWPPPVDTARYRGVMLPVVVELTEIPLSISGGIISGWL